MTEFSTSDPRYNTNMYIGVDDYNIFPIYTALFISLCNVNTPKIYMHKWTSDTMHTKLEFPVSFLELIREVLRIHTKHSYCTK